MESFGGGGNKEGGFNHEDLQRFGDLLRRAREATVPNLSLAKAAKQLGVGLSTLAKWELGSSTPEPEEEKLPVIAEFYKIDLSVLKEAYDAYIKAKEAQMVARGLKTPGGTPKIKKDPDTDVFWGSSNTKRTRPKR
jgi:transcriptional regulator with XRE-family HTH domain